MAVFQKDSTTITKDDSGRRQKIAISDLIKSKENKPEKIPSKPKLELINSKPVLIKEFQIESPGAFHGLIRDLIPVEKNTNRTCFSFLNQRNLPLKSRLRHSSQPIPNKNQSYLFSILRKIPDSTLKLPPIEKLSLPPSVPVRKSATWPEMASAHIATNDITTIAKISQHDATT